MESSSVEAGGHNAVEFFLQAMRTSKVFEDRIELINQLGTSSPTIVSNLRQIVEGLVAFWEETSCSGVSHCKCNISILHVAQQHLQYADTCDIFSHYVILSTKASKWCRIHFHSFFTTKDSNEESHMTTFIQLLLGSLNFASATSLALANCSYLFKDQFLLVVEDFISEQLNLIKDSVSDIKKMHSESEILKAGQELLGAAIRLSSIYCRSITNSDLMPTYQKDDIPVDDGRKEVMPHIVNIASCTIENLYELGILAATGGGNLVTILNISWKGVVSLLQLEVGKEVMASKVNISNIILTLISLATDSLKLSAESWILQSPDGNSNLHSVTDTEARRSCIPIKFYLINAVRISSSYPCQAFRVYDDIISCALKIFALRFVLSNQEHLKAGSEALAEILEPTSFIFLCLLLSSGEAGLEFKLEVLDRLFPNINSAPSEESADDIPGEETIISELFSSKKEDRRILLFGRLAVLFNLLQNLSDFGADVVLGISKKLDWLLDAMAQEDIYVSTLQAQFPNITRSDSATDSTRQFMFPSILHALKMFFIVVAPSAAWMEVESFLFRNIIHPHALCWGLVLELWCFMVRHAQLDMVEQYINVLCSLLKTLALSNSISCSHNSLIKLARSLCTILKHVPQSIVELVYHNLLSGGDAISKPSVITAILLQEGFPLRLLSENSKKQVVMQITSAFSEFAMKLGEKLVRLNSRCSPSVSSALPKDPIYLLSLILSQCESEDHLQIEDECIHKVPKLAVAIMKAYRLSKESSQRHYYSNLLSHALEGISYVSHRIRSTDIQEVLTTLGGLVTTGDSTLDEAQVEFKPALALFLASLSAVEIPEDEGNVVSKAIWQLYHLILRERHWAGVHLGLSSFGYFAARTSCNELWRFVPLDAALSFDIESGQKTDVEQFMSELKSFLVKEGALTSLSASKEEKNLLRREGLLQNEILKSYLQMSENSSVRQEHDEKSCDSQEMEIDANENGKQKLKYLDGVKEGMSLLQKGLSLLTENFAKWQDEGLNPEQRNQLADHLSCLANTIDQVASFGHSWQRTL